MSTETEREGKFEDLTPVQAEYLKAIASAGCLQYGQGGCKSTRTIRALQAKGLIMVNPHRPGPGGWSAQLTLNGRLALEGEEGVDRG